MYLQRKINMSIHLLLQHPLFHNFSEAQLRDFLSAFSHSYRNYQKNDILLQCGDNMPNIGILLSGSLLVYNIDESGYSNIVNEIFPPQSFGEALVAAGIAESPFSIRAIKDCRVFYLAYQDLITRNNSVYYPLLMANLAQLLAEKVMTMNFRLVTAAQRKTRDKLLAYLYQQKQRQKSSTITLPLNREQLADYLFVDRSALSAVLMKLKKDGLLDYHKNIFTIK